MDNSAKHPELLGHTPTRNPARKLQLFAEFAAPEPQPPVVSVILPTFNRLRFLPAAIESVFAQTFEDWELIVADDGSDEETRAYLRTLQSHPRVKIIWRAHCGNPGAVRNAALREARGEFVAFLDSDDVWMHSKLAQQVESLRSGTGCRWGYTALVDIDEFGRVLNDGVRGPWVPHEGAVLEQLIRMEAVIATPSVIAERRLVEAVGGFDEKQLLYEDYDLWIRLAMHSEADVTKDTVVFVRRHAQHYSSEDIRALEGRRRLFEKSYELISSPRLRSILRSNRAKNAARFAAKYAASGDPVALSRVLIRSLPYSWTCGEWRRNAIKAVVRLLAPVRLLAMYRSYRERIRSLK